jgi:hypothetical protein
VYLGRRAGGGGTYLYCGRCSDDAFVWVTILSMEDKVCGMLRLGQIIPLSCDCWVFRLLFVYIFVTGSRLCS